MPVSHGGPANDLARLLAQARQGRRVSADRIAETLCWNGTVMRAVEPHADGGADDDFNRLRDHRAAATLLRKLAEADEPYPFLGRRVAALLEAGVAARHRRDGRAEEASDALERAVTLWAEEAEDPTARVQVLDLVASLAADSPEAAVLRTARRASMPVAVPGSDGVTAVILVSEIVEDGPPGAWPCPRRMAFTRLDVPTVTAMADQFASSEAARALGVRWWLTTPAGQPLRKLNPAELTGPLGVLVESLAERCEIRGSITIVARADPAGRLTVADGADELTGHMRTLGMTTIVPGDVRRGVRRRLGSERRLTAPEVSSALRLARRITRRQLGLRWVAGIAAGILVLSGVVQRINAVFTDEGDAAKQGRIVRELVADVRRDHARAPTAALAKALAAQRVQPGGAAARSALMTSIYGDVRLREVLHGAPVGLRLLEMARNGSAIAAVGGAHEIVVWTPTAGRSVPPRTIPTGGAVSALALSVDGGTLAYAGDGLGVRWVELSSGRTRELSMPAGQTPGVEALAFASRGTALAAGTRTGGVFWRHPGDTGPVRLTSGTGIVSTDFNHTGRKLVQVARDGRVTSWSNEDGRIRRVGEERLGSPGTSAVYSADGRYVYATTFNGQIHTLDARSGRRLETSSHFVTGAHVLAAADGGVTVVYDSGVAVLSVDGLKGGEHRLWEPRYAPGAPVDYLAAASADAVTTVVSTGGGNLAIYGEGARLRSQWYKLQAYHVEPLPEGDLALGLFALHSKNAGLLAFHPSNGRGVARAIYPSEFSLSPGQISARTRSAAVVTDDERVLVWRYDGPRRMTQVAELRAPSPTSLSGLTALDDTQRRLFAIWGTTVVTYSYDGSGPPRRLAVSRIERPLGCVVVDARRSRLIGCTRDGLEMWPIGRDGRPGKAVQISQRQAVRALVDQENGTIVGLLAAGEGYAYDIGARGSRERALSFQGNPPATALVAGGMLTVAGRTQLAIIDLASGDTLLSTRFPSLGDYVTGAWHDRTGLHLGVGLGLPDAGRFDLLTDPAALTARACAMVGREIPRTVGDVEQSVPERLRGVPLCP